MLAVLGGLALVVAAQPGFGTAPGSALAGGEKVPTKSNTTTASPTTTSKSTAPVDGGSMALVTEATGARAYWNAGFTGKGIDIAIIDSGLAPVEGLSTPGKVILGPDLSFESQDESTRYLDTNGHGTHLAGIMAGRDAAASGNYASDVSNFLGMAPDARVLSVKVADAQGHTDVSQVIAAIDWVVQHKNDNGMNVRVLLLAFGTNSTSAWWHDPLVQAAEVAWKNGIFVVVAAGNDGENPKWTGTLSNIARSPNIMTVGATDTVATATLSDDFIPPFSSSGNYFRRVDVVAPGSHIGSLKVPGSFVEQNFSGTGAYGERFFRGSGTSQAAAVVAGAAALIIQQHPDFVPDDVRVLLRGSAVTLAGEKAEAQGAGEIDLRAALNLKLNRAEKTYTNSLGEVQAYYDSRVAGAVWSDGMGSIESARGTVRLIRDGIELKGDIDIFGAPYDSATMARLRQSASGWSDGYWNGNEWTASSWSASSWSASSWSASSWSASSWSASSWSASSWSASSWSASSWSASSWSASSWAASSWSASSWSASGWY